MIHVWYSNQLERLAEKLIGNLKALEGGSGRSLFAMPPIVVPNRNIETYLRYEIARRAGIAAGLSFLVPERFQDELLSHLRQEGQDLRRLHSAVLRPFLLDLLSEPKEVDNTAPLPLPGPVQSYLDAAGIDGDARDLYRFQLAGRLARLFHQYNEARPDLLRDWSTGQPRFAGTEFAATEAWQRSIWERLSRLISPEHPERTVRWVWPFELPGLVGAPEAAIPPEIHVFGFSYLAHGLRELIERLGSDSRIDLYTFAPVDWQTIVAADLSAPNSKKTTRRAGKRRESDNPALTEDESIAIRWGRPGREHFERLTGALRGALLVDVIPSTTLGRLQGEIQSAGSKTDEPFQPDDSLVILACPGIRREAEIVANEIWRLIRDDDGRRGRSADRLRFPDIAVLIADSANLGAYQAHFRAVLEELYEIPFNMVDLPLAGESRLLEAVLLLLDLPLGEFTRPEVLKILSHPAVRARFPEADAEAWRSWVMELEVVHGADREDHRGTYIEGDVFHWDQGLRRLALGAFMTGPHAGDEQIFQLDGAGYLPFDVAADALANVARLVLLVRSLTGDARFARSAQLTMAGWSGFFTAMLDAYVTAETDSEERVRAMCLHEIRRLAQLDVTGHEVGYRIAQACLREAIQGQTAARGYYLADGVVVSPLKEMRALPFRVIFVCGLGEGRFPVRADLDPLDLSAAEPRPGDVSPRDRDKYLFLETLVCARDRLYLSYVAKDAQTGDVLSPSPVVSELIRELHRGRSDEADPAQFWIAEQPLRRFDRRYFDGSLAAGKPASLSLSAAARQEWQALKLRESLAGSGKGLPEISRDLLRQLGSEPSKGLGLCSLELPRAGGSRQRPLAVSLSDIRRFLECPLQGWARVMLRLSEDDDEDQTQRLDERFVSARVDEIGLLRGVFLEAVQNNCDGSSADAFRPYYDKRASLLAHQGLLPVGLFGEVENRRHLDWLAGWHDFASEKGLLTAGPFGIYRFGRAAESERVERVRPSIPVDVKLPGEDDPRRVELYGRTEIVSASLPGSLTPVGRTAASERDFLRGFLDAVVLSLDPGRVDSAEHHAYVIPLPARGKRAKEPLRTFRGIDESKARQFLTTVLADLLGGPHDYLLPCEAVFDYLDPKKKKSIAESVEAMKENDRASCSSRHGPVPDFERYDPPGEEEAHAMIERRFSLFRDSGGSIE